MYIYIYNNTNNKNIYKKTITINKLVIITYKHYKSNSTHIYVYIIVCIYIYVICWNSHLPQWANVWTSISISKPFAEPGLLHWPCRTALPAARNRSGGANAARSAASYGATKPGSVPGWSFPEMGGYLKKYGFYMFIRLISWNISWSNGWFTKIVDFMENPIIIRCFRGK